MGKYSQGDQDDWLMDYFKEHIGIAVDVGASDGVFYSNTLRLEELGWRVVCIEANPVNYIPLMSKRREVVLGGVLDYDGEGELVFAGGQYGSHLPGSTMTPYGDLYRNNDRVVVPVRTLNTVLAEAGIFEPIDFLAMDIEGGEAHALRGLNLDLYAPRLITVEDNHHPKPALPECRAMLAGKYREVHRILDDVFFERIQ